MARAAAKGSAQAGEAGQVKDRRREYVQSGVPSSGPSARWIGRRHGRREDARWATAWEIARRLVVLRPDA